MNSRCATKSRHSYRVIVRKPREIALRCLQRHERSKDYIENLLVAACANARLSPPDRGLIQELVFGCVRWKSTLDWLIRRKTDGREQKPALRLLLHLGLYQLFWLDRIPAHAAVHETVELARESGFGPQSGFINALLRGYQRELDATRALLKDLRQSDPALAWSHPDWLVRRWTASLGAENTRRLLEWNNTPPPTYARVNSARVSPGELLRVWREEEDVEYDLTSFSWIPENTVFRLKAHPSIESMPSFQKGWFYIQDPSTLLAPSVLDPKPGEVILDLCAAPGGKTTRLAELMRDEGRVIARDATPERLKLIQENCRRLGLKCVSMEAAPGETTSTPSLRPNQRHDRVLLDAPCSNTGVMRRRVDLRWRVSPEEIARLAALQAKLLAAAANEVKPGGTLVYSTCSLEREENQEVVAAFLARHSSFQLEVERQLTPFHDQADGAYTARIIRRH